MYDADKSRFDHHQRGFHETFEHGFKTKLSSAGLVYKCAPSLPRLLFCDQFIEFLICRHFGKEAIASHLQLPTSDASVGTLYLKLCAFIWTHIETLACLGACSRAPRNADENFVEALDGIDNGISQYASELPEAKLEQRYKSSTDLSSRVAKVETRAFSARRLARN